MVRFSVIIPVYNDPDGVQDTLDSLLTSNSDYTEYEVIVVDNGSTDETARVVGGYSEDFEHIQLATENDIKGSYAARNEGIRQSSGEILIFIDADMVVGESFFPKLREGIRRTNAPYIALEVSLGTSDDMPGTLVGKYDYHTGFPMEWYLRHHHFGGAGALVVRKEVFDAVGLFDSSLRSGGDKEFGQRVYRAGIEQDILTEVVVNHPVRDSWYSMVKKQYRIGVGQQQAVASETSREDSRPVYHPYNFLPPHPKYFDHRIGDGVSIMMYIVYYLVDYLLKLVQAGGRILYLLRRR